MKKYLIFIVLIFLVISANLQAQSFKFMERDVVFGSTPEQFLETFPEFKMNNELKADNSTGYSFTTILPDCEVIYDVLFDAGGLMQFKLTSNCNSEEKDKHIIGPILSQFEFVPDKNLDEEVMGDVLETYKKDKLIATAFIGGFYILTITCSGR
jgi:hypothetical protein